MALKVEKYNGNEAEWDKFILEESINGTFLQTRRFINYHPVDRFEDYSLCIRKGNTLVATILACVIHDEDGKVFFAHKGTTYGGITVSSAVYSASGIDELMCELIEYLKEDEFEKIYIKMVPGIYQRGNAELLDYFFYKNGFKCYNELNYYLELDKYREDVLTPFSSSKRRDYRYSLKNDLEFKLIEDEKGISEFYSVLKLNLRKLGLSAVHTLEDLIDLKYNRFKDEIEFYGVYYEGKMIAGSMIFIINEKIYHTQYLSSDEQYLRLYPMDFLITNLISTAVNKQMNIFSFGICTEDQGRYLNMGLSRFKEGFGTDFCINRSYELILH